MSKEEKELKDYEINDMRGSHQLKFKHPDGVHQVWVTSSGGRYTVINVGGKEPFVMRSNIRDLDTAKDYIEQCKGDVSDLEKIKVTNAQNPYRMEKKESTSPCKNRVVGSTAFGGWIFLGGGRKFVVWMSPSGKSFQVATRNPEMSITSAMSREKVNAFLNSKYESEGEETPYQQPLPFEFIDNSAKREPIVNRTWLERHASRA